MAPAEVFIGIDVRKKRLDVSGYPEEDQAQFSIDEAGRIQLVKVMRQMRPALIVMAYWRP
jgi:hypothetical protein